MSTKAQGVAATAEVVPFPRKGEGEVTSLRLIKPRVIKQAWLKEYLDLKLQKQALESQLRKVVADLEDKSDILCAYVHIGIKPEVGELTGEVKTVKGRRQVTKELFIEEYGKEKYEELLSRSTPKDKEVFEVQKRVVF